MSGRWFQTFSILSIEGVLALGGSLGHLAGLLTHFSTDQFLGILVLGGSLGHLAGLLTHFSTDRKSQLAYLELNLCNATLFIYNL